MISIHCLTRVGLGAILARKMFRLQGAQESLEVSPGCPGCRSWGARSGSPPHPCGPRALCEGLCSYPVCWGGGLHWKGLLLPQGPEAGGRSPKVWEGDASPPQDLRPQLPFGSAVQPGARLEVSQRSQLFLPWRARGS